jgi:NADPH-dependent glutamate synthase beta subunit-like oxidoreductase
LFDEQELGGGFMRSQIPAFRLPESVLNEEVGYILDLGIHTHFKHYVPSLKELLDSGAYDAIFVGTGAPKGRDLPELPGFEVDRFPKASPQEPASPGETTRQY